MFQALVYGEIRYAARKWRVRKNLIGLCCSLFKLVFVMQST